MACCRRRGQSRARRASHARTRIAKRRLHAATSPMASFHFASSWWPVTSLACAKWQDLRGSSFCYQRRDCVLTVGLHFLQRKRRVSPFLRKNAVFQASSGGEHFIEHGSVQPPLKRAISASSAAGGGTNDRLERRGEVSPFNSAVNGQARGGPFFAMDGADTTDPELGGATLSISTWTPSRKCNRFPV